VDATEVEEAQMFAAKPETRNRGAKPRREMKSNGSCVLWLFASGPERQCWQTMAVRPHRRIEWKKKDE